MPAINKDVFCFHTALNKVCINIFSLLFDCCWHSMLDYMYYSTYKFKINLNKNNTFKSFNDKVIAFSSIIYNYATKSNFFVAKYFTFINEGDR